MPRAEPFIRTSRRERPASLRPRRGAREVEARSPTQVSPGGPSRLAIRQAQGQRSLSVRGNHQRSHQRRDTAVRPALQKPIRARAPTACERPVSDSVAPRGKATAVVHGAARRQERRTVREPAEGQFRSPAIDAPASVSHLTPRRRNRARAAAKAARPDECLMQPRLRRRRLPWRPSDDPRSHPLTAPLASEFFRIGTAIPANGRVPLLDQGSHRPVCEETAGFVRLRKRDRRGGMAPSGLVCPESRSRNHPRRAGAPSASRPTP
jgi:hypothetical protein